MTKRPWYEILAFALPLVGFLAGVGKAEAERLGAPRYELAIEGFDPRDLVRGNYLLYRFVQTSEQLTPEEESAISYDDERIACLAGSGKVKEVALWHESRRPASCKITLSTAFAESEHRFYIQADKGSALEAAVRAGRASVIVVAPPGAEPEVERLLVDGKPASDVSPLPGAGHGF